MGPALTARLNSAKPTMTYATSGVSPPGEIAAAQVTNPSASAQTAKPATCRRSAPTFPIRSSAITNPATSRMSSCAVPIVDAMSRETKSLPSGSFALARAASTVGVKNPIP